MDIGSNGHLSHNAGSEILQKNWKLLVINQDINKKKIRRTNNKV
jgi:hypothetical protein